jgi:hypothetical protein
MHSSFIRCLLNIIFLNFIAFTAIFCREVHGVNNVLKVELMKSQEIIDESVKTNAKESAKDGAKTVSLSNKRLSAEYANELNDAWVKTKYQIMSDEDVIGELSSERKAFLTKEGFEIIVSGTMQISIDSFWGKYHFISDEEMVINQDGLHRFQGQFQEDTDESSVNIDLKDTETRIYGVDKDGDRFEYKFEREEFDAVSENAPWIFIRSGAKEKSLKVLDLDDFEIKDVIYRYKGKDNIDIKGNSFDCHRISFSTPVKRGEQCIVIDKTGAWIAHESGMDADGEYSVTLTELTHSENRL